MDTKSSVIQFLEAHRSQPVSGQQIANHLQISRAAVWKVIQKLQKQGYQIYATPNKGYVLQKESDILSKEGIGYYLPKCYQHSPIEVYNVIESTNKRLKEMASAGAKHHSIIVANEQSAGVGRFGRAFYSPKDTGVYMSVLIRDRKPLKEATMITFMSAIAVCRILKRHSKHEPQIKWVNDIYLESKKVCGILSEAIIDFESGMSEAMIIGIGINISTENFPEDIKDVATSCTQVNCGRNQLVAELAGELFRLYDEQGKEELLNEYRSHSYVLHRHITYVYDHRECSGYVKDINDAGNLIVENDEGIQILESGEVKTVRVYEV